MFDHAAFRQRSTQLRDFADGYEALGLTSPEAAAWANHGFTPSEAAPWLAEGFGPLSACGWASRHVAPAEAAVRAGRGGQAHPNGMHEGRHLGEEAPA